MDFCVLLAASQLALWTRFDEFGGYGPYAVVAGLLLAMNAFTLFGLYRPQALFAFTTLLRLIVTWAFVFLLLIAIGYATGTANEVSRIWVALWFAYGGVGLIVCRVGFRYANSSSKVLSGQSHTVALIGDRTSVDLLMRRLGEAPEPPCTIAGVFFDEPAADADDDPAIERLIAFCRSRRVDEVVITDNGSSPSRLAGLIDRLADLPVDVAVFLSVGEGNVTMRGIRELGAVQLIRIAERPLGGNKALIKRAEDIVVSVLILVLIAPLLPLIALAIKLDSAGPVLFRQTRCGFNNELIEVLKFRTMHVDRSAEPGGSLRQASRGDPRVTRVGRWLRRTSTDELPQFLHVLAGTMSIVGPRPHAVAHHQEFAELVPSYHARHRVKPGITGWAQVNGWRGEVDNIEKIRIRVSLDILYIEKWSLSLDLKIIFMTIISGMMNENAY